MRGFDSLALAFVQIFNMTLISRLAKRGKESRGEALQYVSGLWSQFFAHGSAQLLKQACQSRARLTSDLGVKISAMGVDGYGKRSEIFDPKTPNAFGHEVLPVDAFNRLNLGCFQSCSTSYDGKVACAKLLHRPYAIFQEPAFANNSPYSITFEKTRSETIHSRTCGCTDADGKIAVSLLLDVRRGVQANGPLKVYRRFNTLVENPDLCRVPNPIHSSGDGDAIPDLESSDFPLLQGRN